MTAPSQTLFLISFHLPQLTLKHGLPRVSVLDPLPFSISTHSQGGFIQFSQCPYHLNINSVLPLELQSLDLPACLIFLLEYPISFQSYHVQNQTFTIPFPPKPARLAAWPVLVASKTISSLPGT